MIADYEWEKNSTAKPRIAIGVLELLSSLAQARLLYHTNGVDGNDTLYGLSSDYLEVRLYCALSVICLFFPRWTLYSVLGIVAADRASP